MGDPRKLRKRYTTPTHPWQKQRIDEESALMKEYGFKNKIELWKLNSLLRKFKRQVKELIPRRDEAAELQKKELLLKLYKMNLIKEDAILEDILALSLKDLCERRLQTLLVRKGLARSISQARQFIVHEHIMVGDKKLTSPSIILTAQEESLLRFADTSPIVAEDHPERAPVHKEIVKEMHEAGLKESTEEKPKKSQKSAKQEMKEDIKHEKAEEEVKE
jgi:small subunit ribosomal protein S4